MPHRLGRACTGSPGCPNIVHGRGVCPSCRSKVGRADRDLRGSARERGYDARWEVERVAFLRSHPFCRRCELETPGSIQPATVVDHVVPHKGDEVLFWDQANWQPLCKPHHDRKTATEDGGFGRAVTRG